MSYSGGDAQVQEFLKNPLQSTVAQWAVIIVLIGYLVWSSVLTDKVGMTDYNSLQAANSGPNVRLASMRSDGVGDSHGNQYYDPLAKKMRESFLGGPEPPVFASPQSAGRDVVAQTMGSASQDAESMANMTDDALERRLREGN